MRGFELNELQNPDPLNFVNKTMEIERFIQSGRYSDAVISLDKADLLVPQPEQATAIRRLFLAVSQGETDAIRDALQQYVVADSRTAPIIEPILANFDSETSALAAMRDVFVSDTGLSGEGRVIMASMAAFYGDPQFALDVMSEELSTNVLRINRIWYPYFSEMRGLPGFKNLAEDTGLLSYWRTVEWADSCRPVGDNDFECN
jgi:hypothetical protein